MEPSWFKTLKNLVEKNPIIVLRFVGNEWDNLRSSKNGINQFTVARSHTLLNGVNVFSPCIVSGKSNNDENLYFGLISSKASVTTLETRIKIKRCLRIQPQSEQSLSRLITEQPYSTNLRTRLNNKSPVVSLSQKLSSHLIDKLSELEKNHGVLRALAESLSAPKRFNGTDAFQEDAVKTALATFGFASSNQLKSLELVEGRDSALARVSVTERVSIIEDGVIEHDARQVPGYGPPKSDLTGRAIFERGDEQLEIFTANRRKLELCFGVDLIYLNASKQNIVMLQYKMLEPIGSHDTDWIYRPDNQLSEEISRMKNFSNIHMPGKHEYRLNPTVFYLKFIKRDALIKKGSFITPLDQYEILKADPACSGPKGALRISYKTLNGRYLRQNSFLELIQSGYIGAHAETTKQLMTLVNAVLNGNRAVVAAIQGPRQEK